jgi:hypothetical protein
VIAADEGARAARIARHLHAAMAGRHCGRRGPCRRCRAPRQSACRPLRARCTSRPRASAADGQNGVGERRSTRSISRRAVLGR